MPIPPNSPSTCWTPALTLAIQGSTVWLGMSPSAEFGLPLPGVAFFLLLLGIEALLGLGLGRRLLTRAELLCVFYVLVLAAPLVTQGFWHRVLSITATIPRTADFAKLQFMSDRLWPHGPNLLAAAAEKPVVLDAADGNLSEEFRLAITDKTGGGLAVRTKLQPFFIGVFLVGVAAGSFGLL